MKIDKEQERKEVLVGIRVTLGLYEHISGEDSFALAARVEYKNKLEVLIARANELTIEIKMDEPYILKMRLRELGCP